MASRRKEVLVVAESGGGLLAYKKMSEVRAIDIMDNLSIAKKSIEVYKKTVKIFFDIYGNDRFEDIQRWLSEFIRMKDKTVVNTNTQRVRKYALKAYFLEFFKNANDVVINRIKAIFSAIKLAKEASKAVVAEKVFKVSDIDDLLSVVKISEKQELIIKLLYNTGLRASEAISIRLSDVAESSHKDFYSVRVLGKGNKYRAVYCSRDLIDRIGSLYQGSTYLFETQRRGANAFEEPTHLSYDSLYRMLKGVEKNASRLGLKINPHKFRHSFATHTLEAMKDDSAAVSKISKTLGHSTTAITQDYYIHTAMSVEDMLLIRKD